MNKWARLLVIMFVAALCVAHYGVHPVIAILVGIVMACAMG